MVFVMVQWSRAMLMPRPSGEEAAAAPVTGWSPARRWGFAYLAVWALLIAAFLRFLERVGSRDTASLLLLLLVAAGWLGLNGLIIAFGRAIQRANERAAARAELEEPAAEEEEEVAPWEEAPAVEAPLEEPVPAPAPAPRSRLRGVLGTALTVLLFLLAVGIGEALPPLQRLHAWTLAHQEPLLWVTIPVGAIGFALFMGGIVALVLAGGQPMTREEIDELARRNRELAAGPALWRRSTYRTQGVAVGAQAEDSASFAEVKAAWRARAWQVSPRWRRMFLIMLGVALFVCGLLGSIFVIATAGVKLVIAGMFLYAVVRTAVAFSQA
jgi:hypothetical protein